MAVTEQEYGMMPLEAAGLTPDQQAAWDAQLAQNGRITNMKASLLRHLPSYHALMTWYPLRDEVEQFLGKRATLVFVSAISNNTDCLICSTFFRRIWADAGEDPDRVELDETETMLADFGRQIAAGGHGVTAAMRQQLLARYTEAQLVALTVFGTIMLATNVYNNALAVPLDTYLEPYRKA